MMRMITKNSVPTTKRMFRNRILFCTAAAAAFSTLPGSAVAFTTTLPSSSSSSSSSLRTVRSTHGQSILQPSSSSSLSSSYSPRSSARYMSSSRNNNEKKGGGILQTIKNAAKSVLPSSWFQSDQEKQKAIERRRQRDEINGSLKELLKDAPFPIRMVGSMVGPLMSSAMSTMAESLAEQQKTVETYLSEAQVCLQSDDAVQRLVGDGIQVGSPFSQSSSTSSINGQTTTRVEIGFPVSGSRGSGVAQLSATEAGIQRLILQATGRTIDVNLKASSSSKRKFPGRGRGRGTMDDDDVIEAEIIEKDTRR